MSSSFLIDVQVLHNMFFKGPGLRRSSKTLMTISHFKPESQKQNHLHCNQAVSAATAARRKFTVSVHNFRMSCAVVLYDVNSDSQRALRASVQESELPSGE